MFRSPAQHTPGRFPSLREDSSDCDDDDDTSGCKVLLIKCYWWVVITTAPSSGIRNGSNLWLRAAYAGRKQIKARFRRFEAQTVTFYSCVFVCMCTFNKMLDRWFWMHPSICDALAGFLNTFKYYLLFRSYAIWFGWRSVMMGSGICHIRLLIQM